MLHFVIMSAFHAPTPCAGPQHWAVQSPQMRLKGHCRLPQTLNRTSDNYIRYQMAPDTTQVALDQVVDSLLKVCPAEQTPDLHLPASESHFRSTTR